MAAHVAHAGVSPDRPLGPDPGNRVTRRIKEVMVRPSAPMPDIPPVFTVQTALAQGVSHSRLRRHDLVVPTRGVRSVAPVTTVHERAAAHQLTLPAHAAWARVTAARLWDLPLPRSLENPAHLDLIVPTAGARTRRAGCVGTRGAEHRSIVMLGELRCTDLVDTWIDLAAVREMELDDLVVAGDVVANRVGIDAMRATLLARHRPQGARRLRDALAAVRTGSRSPMETKSRLMFVRAGFPEPRLNTPVKDRFGTWILTPDLLWDEQKVIGEYLGEGHETIERLADDSARRDLAGDEGYTIIDIFKSDVFRPGPRAHCLRRFARALGLDPRTLTIE